MKLPSFPTKGQPVFWKATFFVQQRFPGDFFVCLRDVLKEQIGSSVKIMVCVSEIQYIKIRDLSFNVIQYHYDAKKGASISSASCRPLFLGDFIFNSLDFQFFSNFIHQLVDLPRYYMGSSNLGSSHIRWSMYNKCRELQQRREQTKAWRSIWPWRFQRTARNVGLAGPHGAWKRRGVSTIP